MANKKRGAFVVVIKVALWYAFILGAFAGYTNWLPQIRGDAPEAAVAIDVNEITPEQLATMGEKIIFGSNDPLGVLAKGEGPIGKGQCPLCHRFFMEQKADRCPNLLALPNPETGDPLLKIPEEARSYKRPLTPRYAEFKKLHANGEKNSGITPHAKPGGQYLIESEYCPNCFVVRGYGLKGTNDTVSPMPIINKPPIELADTEIVAVVSFLQTRDGDFSKWTAKDSWEGYWGRELVAESSGEEEEKEVVAGPVVALGADTPEQVVQKMTCFACHKIPGISIAKTGLIGPLLIEKENAPNRIKSPEYLARVKKGKAHATTPREYVIESIMDPAAFIVPGFADDMLKDFRHKMTISGLSVIVDHVLKQGIEEALAEDPPMDRLPNEKEGSILPKQTAAAAPDETEEVAEVQGGKQASLAGQASTLKLF